MSASNETAAGDAIEAADEQAADSLYRRLSKQRRRVLRYWTRTRSRFESRLRKRWGEALGRYYECYAYCQEVGASFNERRRP